jgi:DNA invertase Pin-like site-specific DNA recombinase
MKTAIYGRVSTDSQDHDSQLQECRDWCARFNLTPTEYLDTASGMTTSREALDDLMAKVRKGKVDVVVCYKLDRLGRSLSHLTQLVEEFDKYRVALVCPSQGIDTRTTSPGARFQLQIFGAVAEFERGMITERVNAGIAAARRRGVRMGRPPGSKLRITPAQCLAARQNGLSLRQTGKELGVSEASVRRILAKG